MSYACSQTMPSLSNTPDRPKKDEAGKRNIIPQNITLSDCKDYIENALSEKRITSHKASRLRHCLQSSSREEIIYQLLREQIPNKRSKVSEGYKCRLCNVPLKGHVCPYCPVCSTDTNKYLKDGNHTCTNCPQCFDVGRRKKKCIQIKIGENSCPHGKEKGDEAAAALIDMRKGVVQLAQK